MLIGQGTYIGTEYLILAMVELLFTAKYFSYFNINLWILNEYCKLIIFFIKK